MTISVRHKASSIRIANRKSVEAFMGRRFHLPTRLRTAAPDIAADWNYEKNPMHLYPEIIGIGHMNPVWWKCGQCAHEYCMSVEKRVVRGGGCDKCSTVPVEGDSKTLAMLVGELSPAMRAKRPTMLNVRTRY